MPLQEELDAVRAWYEENAPRHITFARRQAVDGLIFTGVAEKAIRAGDHLPAFQLRDADGQEFSAYELLVENPLLIIFYRGRWCPYCSLDLQAIEATADELRISGATIVAVSQQSAEEARATESMYGLSFPNLIDRGGRVARAFGLRWNVPRDLRAAELETGLDLAVVNGEPSWTLTMPARYIVGSDGIVEYADVSADYTSRGDPSELLPVVRRMSARRVH